MAEPNPNGDKDFYTSDEAAQYCGVRISTIYSWVHDDLIPHYKPGGRLLFKRSELRQWIESSRVPTQEELLTTHLQEKE